MSDSIRQVFASSILCFMIGTGVCAQVKPNAGMMRYPDVSKDRIVFVYGDDLWTVSRDGGEARPLASPAGAERNPRFSPDGMTIAFKGNYDGGQDLYTIPVDGGVAVRMTYHPASEILCDWHPSGEELIYSTNGFAGLTRQFQLFTISNKNPLPTKLPVPYGSNGAISSDGKWLAYTPHSRDTRTWKRYRGGMASDIWIFHLEKHTAKRITDFEGTDSIPMWHDNTVYYLSDGGEEHRLNIWSYDTNSGARTQITKYVDHDCKWPSVGPGSDGKGEIVFQNGTDLILLDLASKKAKSVEVTIPGDRPQLRPQKIDASKFVVSFDISPTGKRIAVEARGDIWTLPAENGSPYNLTRTSEVAERDPAWSPDGQWIAYFSDKTDEYELYVTQSDGRGATKKLTEGGTCFRYTPTWSPDSKHISFTDKTGGLFLYSFESEALKQVDIDPYAQRVQVSWSHNSQWITYALLSDEKASNSAVWVFNVKDGQKLKLTSGYFQDSNPVFDRKGEFIYFSSNRAFTTPQYEDLGTSFIYSGTEILVAMPLRSDVKHPFKAKNDEESWKKKTSEKENASKEGTEKSDGKAEKKADKGKKDGEGPSSEDDEKDAKKAVGPKAEDKAKAFTIESDGIERRAIQLPVGQGTFGGLGVNDKNHLVYAERPARGSQKPPAIKILDITSDKREAQTVVEGASGFAVSGDGKKLIVVKSRSAYIIAAAASQKLAKSVPTNGMTVLINPREEWKQMFAEAWRLQRDFFYDPNMHGVDWPAVRKHYASMLDDCVTRRDLSFVISEMIAEINVGHAYYREGDVKSGPSGSVGLLGCRFESDGTAYRIAELYEGAEWDVDARNTLRESGVKVGEYIVAVNGRGMSADQNPYSMFQDMAGLTVTLTVSSDNKIGDKDRQVTLKLSGSDTNQRFRSWIEKKRKLVEEQTDGKVGYIYVINTGVPGQNDLVRQYFAQMGKQALIIDDRWNGGGQIPTRFIELLNRPVTNYWAKRDGRDWTWPPDAHHGPKCMLINGMAGSGGDMFPALFSQSGLGKLIGMRTWGGLVGISGNPGLIDGASVTVPTFAYYEKDGTWGIEGHGVDPDIEVIDNPEKMVTGGDPQLSAAIMHILKQVKKKPYSKPDRPAYPDRSKFGLKPEDK